LLLYKSVNKLILTKKEDISTECVYFIASSVLTFNSVLTISTIEIWIMQFRLKAKEGLYQKYAKQNQVRPLNSAVTPSAKSCFIRLRNCRDETSGQRARRSQFIFKSHNLRLIKYWLNNALNYESVEV